MPTDMRKLPFSFISCLLVFVVCLTRLAIPATVLASSQTELRIGYQPLSSPTGAIFEAIMRDLLLRQELGHKNVTLKFIPFKKGTDSIEAFKRGELDAIAMGDLPMIEFALTTPVVIIGQLRQGFSTIVAPRGTTPLNLKGKRIGNAFASSGHYALLKTLQNAGLAERDVTLIPLDVNKMSKALLDGKIDAFSAWEPTPYLFIAQYPDRFSSVGRQSGSGYLSVARRFADRHPESIPLLAAGVARAMQWFSKNAANLKQAALWNRASIQKLTGTESHASPEELSRQTGADLQVIHYSAKLPPMKDRGKNLLLDEFTFLKAIGRLPQTARWQTIRNSFDHSIMDRIYRNQTASSLNRFSYELK
jgi:ABC-type nitrate/sulfonate/bicarbonate transport system substrate-binding protein